MSTDPTGTQPAATQEPEEPEASETHPPMALWGGRFSGGPAAADGSVAAVTDPRSDGLPAAW